MLLMSQSILAAQHVDPQSGLIIDSGFTVVKKQCSQCHSPQLIIQNKASYQGWLTTLRWMQEKQGMQSISQQTETLILNYLAKNYAPEQAGRRQPLVIEQWKKLNTSGE
jgi:hypothetical protein